MPDSAVIFSDELAARLGVTEAEIHELARLGRLPFAVSSSSPRRVVIQAAHYPLWKAAVEADCCDT